MKVMTIVGTRPEIIRLSRVMVRLDELFDHKIVHTGQNYDFELNQIFFDQLGIRKPDFFLGAASASAASTIAKCIELVDEVLATERPDAVLILGDTNSCLSTIAAKKRHIPIFHMEDALSFLLSSSLRLLSWSWSSLRRSWSRASWRSCLDFSS